MAHCYIAHPASGGTGQSLWVDWRYISFWFAQGKHNWRCNVVVPLHFLSLCKDTLSVQYYTGGQGAVGVYKAVTCHFLTIQV